MASWRYAFLFPGTDQALWPANAISTFVAFGLEFAKVIWELVPIDEHAHLEAGSQEQLTATVPEELVERLTKGEQFQVECRNQELFFSCSFDTGYANPHVVIAWSKRLFRDLSRSRQKEYWDMLRQCAKQCRAAYVVIVDDPPDFFEDRFLEIDGQRFLENRMPSGNKYDIHAIWADIELCDKVPEGIDESSGREIPDGFVEYSVPNRPPQQTT